MRTTRDSFLIRVYRYDPEDQRRIMGLVEATDGSGITARFADTSELAVILNRLVGKRRRLRRPTEAERSSKARGGSP